MNDPRERILAFVERASGRASAVSIAPKVERVGYVTAIADGLATIVGLPDTALDERLLVGDGVPGIALRLDETIVCVMLDDHPSLRAGARAVGTSEVVRVPVGSSLLGRIVDPLGRAIDGRGPIAAEGSLPIEREAPAIVDRDLVREPLETGILAIDAAIPLGRGQRQLVIGDRKTGKTSIAVDTMIRQRSTDVICVYASIGQKASSVEEVVAAVREHGAPERTVFVVGAADAPPGRQWITPYAACTIAEYFRDRGEHVLLVLDDLTKHASVYREISLLMRNPPGREAFPGDIFYTHSRLLERAGKLSNERGGGSLSVLALAETQAGDLTGYIPTNLVSITDGQVYLDAGLFHEGHKPAIHVGKSVSRVGGKAQSAALTSVSRSLRLEYAQFVELEVFTRFGAVQDERARKILERGKRIRALLGQPRFAPLGRDVEVALLLALGEGLFDGVPVETIAWVRERVVELLSRGTRSKFVSRAHADLTNDDRAALLSAVRHALASDGPPDAPRKP